MKGAWVTLATNDSYSLGALVLAHSLKQVGTTQELAILVTPGVTNSMRTRLSEVFNLVQEVNVLDSRDQANLRLLQRPELGITFTKLHCWRLTQYEKCVFLDADTLVLQNCDELFDREEFSAAPDVGWPDCFNSGVFVYRPSGETYDKLIQFALEKGSFDGGDQGLLNLYFSDWAHKDISKHLPFIYNVCSTAFYSYLPAFKQYGKDVKILHFIGNAKPWLQYFDTETRQVRPSGDLGHLSAVLQRWWDIFCHMVHLNLSPDMSASYPDIVSESTPPQSHQTPYTKPDSPVVHKRETLNVWDPWEEYDKKQQNLSSIDTEPSESHNTNAFSFTANAPSIPCHSVPSTPTFHEILSSQTHQPLNSGSSIHLEYFNINQSNSETHSEHTKNQQSCHEFSHHQNLLFNANEEGNSVPVVTTGCPNEFSESLPTSNQPRENTEISASSASKDSFVPCSTDNFSSQALSDPPKIDPVHPPCPPELFPIPFPPKALEECETAASINNGETEGQNETQDSGLAGAFAKLTLGQHRTPEQEALENSLRRQNWEQGNIDYLGKDSFDNIWSKICETISKGGAQQEEAVEGLQVASLATTAAPQAATEQQVTEQSTQEIATAAETPKEEPQASETKESPVAPAPVQELVTSPREEAVSMLPISEKDKEVALDDTLSQSSETPSKIPSETPREVSAIPTDTVVIPNLPASAPIDGVAEQVEPLKSSPLQAENAKTESTTAPINVPEVISEPATIPQETISSQSQISEKVKETAIPISTPSPPEVPQTPAKLEEATQALSASGAPVNASVTQADESAKSEPAAIISEPSIPQPLKSAQLPNIVDKMSTEAQFSPDKTSSLEQTTITQTPTPTSQTSAQELSPSPAAPPSENIVPPVQIASEAPAPSPVQTPSVAPTTHSAETIPPIETPISTESSVDVAVTSPCQPVSAEGAKIPSPPVKPTETSPQISSSPVKESVSKESQSPKARDSAASTNVPSETKQTPASPSANVDACPIAPPPRKSGGAKKQGKSKK